MYCKKCGKQIDDDSKFCEHCGYKFIENEPKDTSKRKHKIVIVTIVIIIIIGILFGLRNLFNSNKDKAFAISRNDGSTYLVDLSNLDTSINALKEEWTIENQIGIIDNLEDKATSVVILKSKNIESNEEEFDSYYYASYIDLDSGTIENLNIQIPKSYGIEEVFNKVTMYICQSGKGASVVSKTYGEPVQLSQAEQEKRNWCISVDRGETINVEIRYGMDIIYSNNNFSCNANNWLDVLNEMENMNIANFEYEMQETYMR